MKSKTKRVLVSLVFVAIGQILLLYQSQGKDQYRPVSKPVPLFELLPFIDRGDNWTRVAVVTGGKARLIDHRELRSDVPVLMLGEADLVALDEAADQLVHWTSSHPSESIPLSILRGLPADLLFRADGSPANPIRRGNTKRNNTDQVRENSARPTPISVPPTRPSEVEPKPPLQDETKPPEPAKASTPQPPQPAKIEPPHASRNGFAWGAALLFAICGGLLWLLRRKRT